MNTLNLTIFLSLKIYQQLKTIFPAHFQIIELLKLVLLKDTKVDIN